MSLSPDTISPLWARRFPEVSAVVTVWREFLRGLCSTFSYASDSSCASFSLLLCMCVILRCFDSHLPRVRAGG